MTVEHGLTEEDLELMKKTRQKHKVDLVLDTTDANWLRQGKRVAPKEEKEKQ